MYCEEIELVQITEERDGDGYVVNTEYKKLVFADAQSVKREEFYSGMKAGIVLSATFVMMACDYENQQYVDYDGVRYKVVRTYRTGRDQIELNCTEVAR